LGIGNFWNGFSYLLCDFIGEICGLTSGMNSGLDILI